MLDIYSEATTILCLGIHSVLQWNTRRHSSDALSLYIKLEQLERLRSEDTPTTSWLPIPLSHIGSQVKRRQSRSYKFKKFQIFEFWNRHYMRHTFFSCLIRCANMKWIRWVLLKIQSGHDFVHRRTDRTDGQTDGRTDGQGDTSIPSFQLRWSGGHKKLQYIA